MAENVGSDSAPGQLWENPRAGRVSQAEAIFPHWLWPWLPWRGALQKRESGLGPCCAFHASYTLLEGE